MTNYPAVLKELLIAGYEGAALLSAFERMCAAIGVAAVATLVAPTAKPASKSATEAAIKPANGPRPQPVAYAPPENAKTIGRKALLASGLAASVTKVGSQLLEHYNVKSGRCDPGCKGMAVRLGLSLRSVQRAVAELVSAGLFTVAQNAGQGHRNAYFPVWPRMIELAETVSTSPPNLSQTPDKIGDQNHGSKPNIPSVVVKSSRGRQPIHDPRQRAMLLPMRGGKATALGAVADTEARKRVSAALHQHLSNLYLPDKAAFAQALQRAWEMDIAAVVAAETARKGSGLALWLELMASDHNRAAG